MLGALSSNMDKSLVVLVDDFFVFFFDLTDFLGLSSSANRSAKVMIGITNRLGFGKSLHTACGSLYSYKCIQKSMPNG